MPEARENESTARIIGITLVNTEVAFTGPNSATEELEFNYDAQIDDLERIGDELYAFAASYTIEKLAGSDSPQKVAHFTATYYCGIRVKNAVESELAEIAKTCAATTVWASFSALASIVTAQMNLNFPTLPPTPASVDMKADTVSVEEGEREPGSTETD
jgi:hypothetical protein